MTLFDSKIDPEDPAKIQFTLRNTGDADISWTARSPPPPFGIVTAHSTTTDTALILWTDSYRTDDQVGTDGKHAWDKPDDIGAGGSLLPGEARSHQYTLHTTTRHISPGTYVIDWDKQLLSVTVLHENDRPDYNTGYQTTLQIQDQ